MALSTSRVFLTTLFALALSHSILAARASAAPAGTQQRDHLTAEEVELVRDNQELDKRTAVFVKAVERRLLAMSAGGAPAASQKKAEKESDKYGALPPSTRAQLLSDVARILDEAATNIDDASLHNEKSSLIPKSLRLLAAACQRFLPQLASARDAARDDSEREWVERAIERAQEVVEAAGKLPADAKK